jgi:hypothetical protein
MWVVEQHAFSAVDSPGWDTDEPHSGIDWTMATMADWHLHLLDISTFSPYTNQFVCGFSGHTLAHFGNRTLDGFVIE